MTVNRKFAQSPFRLRLFKLRLFKLRYNDLIIVAVCALSIISTKLLANSEATSSLFQRHLVAILSDDKIDAYQKRFVTPYNAMALLAGDRAIFSKKPPQNQVIAHVTEINPKTTELENSRVIRNLTATKGRYLLFFMQVPSGATNIRFEITGGSGDADLSVKFGEEVSPTSFDCKPSKTGNSESCNESKSDGKYFIRLDTYQSFSGVDLIGSYQLAPQENTHLNKQLINGQTLSGITGPIGIEQSFSMDVPSGASNIHIEIDGGTGDADLYVRFGHQPTETLYDCRPYKKGNNEICKLILSDGIYHIVIKSFNGYSDLNLTGSYTLKF